MVGIVHSSYYRTPTQGKKGNKASKFTFHEHEGLVSQSAVVVAIKEILSHEFIDCGYRLMTSYLNRDGYLINHKKLYRIMKEEGLLKLENRINRSGSGRKFVKFRNRFTYLGMYLAQDLSDDTDIYEQILAASKNFNALGKELFRNHKISLHILCRLYVATTINILFLWSPASEVYHYCCICK